MTTLAVPEIAADDDALTAALKYAAAGWYLVPVKRGTKHPGSVLGKNWHGKSSRSPEHIVAWFAGTDHGIALHCGRSGAVVFDVDDPTKIPPVLGGELQSTPFQETRPDQPWRGHYLFTAPSGRLIGNSTGKLGGAWGEVRGTNGVIVVAPSHHAEGGAYQWMKTGPVPPLPDSIGDLLPDGRFSEASVSDEEVDAFLKAHVDSTYPDLLKVVLARWNADYLSGTSRHMTAAACLVWALREARAGIYPAREAHDELEARFLAAAVRQRKERADGKAETVRTPGGAQEEWAGLASWAVGQALGTDPAGVLELAEKQVRKRAEAADRLAFDPFAAPLGDDATEDAAAARVEAELQFNREVDAELLKLRIRDSARRRFNAEQSVTPPTPRNLADLLAEPDPEIRYRVDGVWPAGGRVMLTAAFKAGKSTLVANVMRCLVDGGDLLGAWATAPVGRRVVLIDDELDVDTLRRWLRGQGIVREDRVSVLNLRGAVSSFDLTDAAVRAHWTARLVEEQADVVILDCLRPVLDAIGLDEHKDAGRFLTVFDDMLGAAGVPEAIVVHHTGHDGERSRGDSRLRDWPDVEWRLVREKGEETGDAIDPAAKRYFAAYGRDVNVPEGALTYDETNRLLTYEGGSRGDAKAVAALPTVIEALREHPEGLSARAVEEFLTNVGIRQKQARSALKAAVQRGLVKVAEGPRRAMIHTLVEGAEAVDNQLSTSVRHSASVVRQRAERECVSASIDAHTHSRRPEQDQERVRRDALERTAEGHLVDPSTGEVVA